MSAAPKLTKKQKKSLAFRQRKQGRGTSKNADDETTHVPADEDQDLADLQGGDAEVETMGVENKGKGKGARGAREDRTTKSGAKGKEKQKDTEEVVDTTKKRKRDVVQEEDAGADNDASTEIEKPKRKRKKGAALDDDGSAGPEEKVTDQKRSKKDIKQRFILFVGNLKYTTSLETIKKHFAACDPPPTIRLGTPKPSALRKPTPKSKGYAFLEFNQRSALQQALKLHQSDIDGRRINVELTAGGGGNSQSRLTKLKTRNKELDHQRKKKVEKLVANSGGSGETIPFLPERPQRYSATSGQDHVPAAKRTWTVGGSEDGAPHRGGQKHARKDKITGRSKGRVWGTGVNAIPMG